MKKIYWILLLSFLMFAVSSEGCSCEPEEPASAVSASQNQAHRPEPVESPPPQPAPGVEGRSNALLPPDYKLTFSTLGVQMKIHYTQLSASLVRDSYIFSVEAKTRGLVRGEKATLKVPPYLKLSWKSNKDKMKSLADLAGKTFQADCVLLLKQDQWASGSNISVRIEEATDMAIKGVFEGDFRFVSGALQGRTFVVANGRFTAFISKSIPRELR